MPKLLAGLALPILFAWPGAGQAADTISPYALQAAAERFAGRALEMDDRLQLPACAEPLFAWAGKGVDGGQGAAIEARCAVPAWRVFLPLAGAGQPVRAGALSARLAGRADAPKIKRGERIMVAMAGDGWSVSLDAVADADSRDGLVWLRATGDGTRGGRRMLGRVGADGQVTIDGLNLGLNGR